MNAARSLLIATTLGLAACPPGDKAAVHPRPQRTAQAATSRVAPTPTPADTPTPLVARRRELMGTWFELKVATSTSDTARAQAVLDRALDEIGRIEDVLSEWRPHTELSRINRAAGAEPVRVGEETLLVLRAGQDVSRWSGGAFDLSWAALRGLYQFGSNAPPVAPDDGEIARRRQLVNYRDVEIDLETSAVRLRRPGMALGMGGIAKGYALDRAGQMLRQAGYDDYLLFAGGQVQVHGSRGDRPWRVGIKHPREPSAHVGYFELNDGSVSTSGDYEHYYIADGRRVHHIIDPATGKPATRSVAVTMIAAQGTYADALSTACFVLGPERCIALLAHVEGHPQAVIIDPDLRVHLTAGLKDKVVFHPPLEDGRLPASAH